MGLEGTTGRQALIRPSLEKVEHSALVTNLPDLTGVFALLKATRQLEHLSGVAAEVTGVHIVNSVSIVEVDRRSCCLFVINI